MQIAIVVPYADAEKWTPIWAHEEAEIDFLREAARGARNTLAFAATELKHYLERSLRESDITFRSDAPADGCFIELAVERDGPAAWVGLDTSFVLEPVRSGVRIAGAERTGVLYGAYEFLRGQGWRWMHPGLSGEVVPELRDRPALPSERREYRPSMPAGRGFDFEYVSMESAELSLWMARNRLNLGAYRASTAALNRKLGIAFKNGGHIFERILDPDRMLPGGRTVWEAHPEWYGLPADGVRTKEHALRTQFCVSNAPLLEFLGEELLKLLNGPWRQADRLDIWGFDTWGRTCQCAACRQLGNGTDAMLHCLAALRRAIDEAVDAGKLERQVVLVGCGYEGTATLAGPVRPVPESLLRAGDMAVYYPINRCYEHDLADDGCPINAEYDSALRSWLDARPQRLPVVVGEYYNVSRFEDLPLLFTRRIAADLRAYRRAGVVGMTYMHLPLANWGVRTLTQLVYAQLCWDADTDVEAFVQQYYRDRYGRFAPAMQAAYAEIEEAWKTVADWRAWSRDSVLSQLNRWDGGRPSVPLSSGRHLADGASAEQAGRRSVALLERAWNRIREMLTDARLERSVLLRNQAFAEAVNPLEARRLDRSGLVADRIAEDWRTLRYGLDTMTLMTELTAYYNALLRGEERAAEIGWAEIERAEDRLGSCYAPIGFEWPGAGLESKDGLTRSQLQETIGRCRGFRAAAATGPQTP